MANAEEVDRGVVPSIDEAGENVKLLDDELGIDVAVPVLLGVQSEAESADVRRTDRLFLFVFVAPLVYVDETVEMDVMGG